MPVCRFHRVEHGIDEPEWHGLVEEIAHGVDEYTAWRSPVQRLLEPFRPQRQIEAVLEWMARHTPEPLREALCIAEVATTRDLGAPRNWVPRRIRPLDLRAATHFAHFRTNRNRAPPYRAALSISATQQDRPSALRPAHLRTLLRSIPASSALPPDDRFRAARPTRPPRAGIQTHASPAVAHRLPPVSWRCRRGTGSSPA